MKPVEFNVAVEMRVSVQEEKDLHAVEKGIGQLHNVKVQTVKVVDIGFGIKAIQAVLLMPDGEGGVDALEEKVRAIPSVSEVDVQNVTRLI